MKRLPVILLLCAVALGVRAVSTVFTYQGRLTANGASYTGLAEMQFTLFDAPTGGVAVATSTPAIVSVNVDDGLFAVPLDFGVSVFTGAERWLEIGVRAQGGGEFTPLWPRQKVTPAPYAITAGNFTGPLAGDVIGPQNATAVWSVGGQGAANVASGASAANAATSANTANTIVKRDAAGGFSAGAINAASVSGDGSGLSWLNASQLITGTVNDARLSPNVPLLNRNNGFTDSNHFSGITVATNENNVFHGTFTGTFTGSGAGLSDLQASQLTGVISPSNIGAGSISAFMLANGAVGPEQLAAGAVTSAALADGAVNLAKLDTSVVGLLSTTFPNPTPATDDNFGNAVAAMGSDRVLIGAFLDDTGAPGAGAAYLFSTSGMLLTAFTNPTASNAEQFGRSVAAVGLDKVLIGAPVFFNNQGVFAGAAYLFNTNGTLSTTFTNPTPANNDFFGNAVAAAGSDRVLIAAYGDDAGATNAGVAYLFSTSGTLFTTFTNPAPAAGDEFGSSVAWVGADNVLIGAYRDNTGAEDAGAAYLFSTNGTLLTTFTNPTPRNIEWFGESVAAFGADRVLIGARFDDTAGQNGAGAVYLFSTDGTLIRTFTSPAPGFVDFFGISVAAVGTDRILIGATGDDIGGTNSGAAYLFDTNGTLLATFPNPAPALGDNFGNSLAGVGSDKILVGAHQDDLGATNAGVAYLFGVSVPHVVGLISEGVVDGAISAASLENGAVTAAKLDPTLGLWTSAGNNVHRPAGNVGIGTTTPVTPLHIAAAEPVLVLQDTDSASTQSGYVGFWNSNPAETAWVGFGTPGSPHFSVVNARTGGNIILSPTSGNVGIGTASPQAPLQVAGANAQLRLFDSVRGNYWSLYTETLGSAAASGNLLFFPGPTGVYGFIQKTTGNYFSSSDARLKQEVRDMNGVLDCVLRLRPVSYRFKSAPESASRALGLIAQEVEPLFPEVVSEHDGMKALAYSALVPVTISAIQELNQKLEQKLEAKETEIAELKARLEKLERRFNPNLGGGR